MTGTTPYQSNAQDPLPLGRNIYYSHMDLVRTIQMDSGKPCFATELTHACPEIYCQWRDDCYRFRAG